MITVDRKQFTRAIDLACSAIYPRNTIPALSAVKIVPNGSLAFHGSDLDVFTTAEIAYDGKGEDVCLLNPRMVRAAVNAAGGSKVKLQGETSKRIGVQAGELSASVATLPADDYVNIDRIGFPEFTADIGGAELAAIKRIFAAISTEETRYYLNGICVRKVGDWLYRFAATDGHRLMMIDVPLPNVEGAIPENTIIPKRWLDIALARFARAKNGARLVYGRASIPNAEEQGLAPSAQGGARLALAGEVEDGLRFTLTGKLIDGNYPDYSRVVPQEVGFTVRVRRADLIHAINALTPLASHKTRAVRLLFEPGHMVLELNSPDIGESRYRISAEHKAPADFKIGFNGQYLLDMCVALRGDEMDLGLTDDGSPTLITDPADTAFRAVLMPMRV